MTIVTNIKDPLKANRPDAERQLFEKIAQVCNGFPVDAIMGALLNVQANALRQACSTRDKAIAGADSLNASLKKLVDKNYNPNGSRLQGVYPFDQHIIVPKLDLSKLRG